MSSPASLESFARELNRLVAKFEKEFAAVTDPGYSEARLRQDYLDPLIRALGWDLENHAGLVQQQREVEIESRTDVAGRAKRADYLFRTDTRDRFICEAKKPRVVLGPRDAFQPRLVLPFYLLAVLNSRVIRELWVSRFYDQRTTFPKIKGTYLKLLPVPVPTTLAQGKLAELAEKRRNLGVKLRAETRERERAVLANAVQTTDRKIDDLVYELYGLTKEEIALVEKA